MELNGSPIPKAEASPVAKADSGYGAPSYAASYAYGAPVRRPRYRKKGPTHTHHHYYHHGESRPSYHAPKPSYHKPSYEPPAYDYGPPARRPIRYAPSYGILYNIQIQLIYCQNLSIHKGSQNKTVF